MGAAARRRPGPGRWAGEGACARYAQLRLASLPHPALKRTGEPVASTAPSLLPRAPGTPRGLVSKGWSLPTPPGTEPCPRA